MLASVSNDLLPALSATNPPALSCRVSWATAWLAAASGLASSAATVRFKVDANGASLSPDPAIPAAGVDSGSSDPASESASGS